MTDHAVQEGEEPLFGISASFLSRAAEDRGLEHPYQGAHDAIFDHSEWRRWLREHLDPDEFWVMHFEDRDKPRKLIRRDSAFFYVPAADFPEDRLGQRQHMEALIAEFLRAIADRRGAPPPPGALA